MDTSIGHYADVAATSENAIEFQHVVIHQLPRGNSRSASHEDIVRTSAPTMLPKRTAEFFRDMVKPIIPRGRSVTPRDASTSDTPEIVKGILDHPEDLVALSARLLDAIFQVRSGNSPSSLFMVAAISHESTSKVLILLAEHQDGVRVKTSESADGTRVSVEYLDELVVGERGKLYKFALFEWSAKASRLRGLMADQQAETEASYFLDEFLGCEPMQPGDQLVKRFVDSAEDYIKSDAVVPAKRARYLQALAATLSSPEEHLSPTKFTQTFIDPEDQDDFLAALPSTVRHAEFRKDTRLVKARTGGVQYQSSTGVYIFVPADLHEEGLVSEVRLDDGSTEIRVLGSLSDSRLSRAGRR